MIKKFSALVLTFFFAIQGCSALACSDIFINNPKGHIDARIMDFSVNIANETIFGFIGQKNTTDVVVDADKIPAGQLRSWVNKYGFWGRGAFGTPKLDDAMNTEGLSVSGLYLSYVTKYPVYDSKDKRPVLGVIDIAPFLMSQCRNVDEAVALLKKTQVVRSAIQIKPGVFVGDIPLHFSLRDCSGKSAVVEFVGGSMQIYENAVNVLTNDPAYPEQLAGSKKYDAITPKSTDNMLTGLPGSYDSPSRFARGLVLTRSLPKPRTHQEALYQADITISSLLRPFFAVNSNGSNSCSIWLVMKDLDEKVIYEKTLLFYQGGLTVAAPYAGDGYQRIDLQAIDFSVIPPEYAACTIQPTAPENVKKLISAADMQGFGL